MSSVGSAQRRLSLQKQIGDARRIRAGLADLLEQREAEYQAMSADLVPLERSQARLGAELAALLIANPWASDYGQMSGGGSGARDQRPNDPYEIATLKDQLAILEPECRALSGQRDRVAQQIANTREYLRREDMALTNMQAELAELELAVSAV